MLLQWLRQPPRKVVSVVALRGLIGAGRVGSLSMERCESMLQAVRVCGAAIRAAQTYRVLTRRRPRLGKQAFSGGLFWRAPDAVVLAVNSPGGSPVQSAALYRRIRELAAKRNTKVLCFCEDVAASGGFYLACAADEIYANEARSTRAAPRSLIRNSSADTLRRCFLTSGFHRRLGGRRCVVAWLP